MERATLVRLSESPEARTGEASVAGLTIRGLRAPDDYSEMNRIANAERERIGIAFTTTVDQLADYYKRPSRFDAIRDLAIFELDGRMAGYARGRINQVVGGAKVHEIVPFLDPAVDVRSVFPLMLSVVEAHHRRMAADDPTANKVLQTFGGDAAPERDAIIVAAGFDAVRHSYTMVRPHVEDLPDADLPAGLEIRPVRAEDVRAIWDAGIDAFRDAWGFIEPDEDDYGRFLTDPMDSQRELWRVAWDGDEVAGQVRSFINEAENERFGRRRGYTESISVRRPWRRRGLARALIGASIRALRERGMTETALGVDTQNVTGALALYESCGYIAVSRTTTFEKPLD